MLLVLLTIAVEGGIFLWMAYRLWMSPPRVYMQSTVDVRLPPFAPVWQIQMPRVEVDLSRLIPDHLHLTMATERQDSLRKDGYDDSMPQEVIDYIDMESEEHARAIRKTHARSLRVELGSWEKAFNKLQVEDHTFEG